MYSRCWNVILYDLPEVVLELADATSLIDPLIGHWCAETRDPSIEEY